MHPTHTFFNTHPCPGIYDVPKMQELLSGAGISPSTPEFFPTPSCPFYNKDGQVRVCVTHMSLTLLAARLHTGTGKEVQENMFCLPVCVPFGMTDGTCRARRNGGTTQVNCTYVSCRTWLCWCPAAHPPLPHTLLMVGTSSTHNNCSSVHTAHHPAPSWTTQHALTAAHSMANIHAHNTTQHPTPHPR